MRQDLVAKIAASYVQLRDKAGLTDADVARATDGAVDSPYLYKLRQVQNNNPGFFQLWNIASALGVPLAKLTGDLDEQLRRIEPTDYYASRYGISNPDDVRLLHELARMIAGGKEESKPGGFFRTSDKRLCGEAIQKGTSQAGYEALPDDDPLLTSLVVDWQTLNKEQKAGVLFLVKQISSRR